MNTNLPEWGYTLHHDQEIALSQKDKLPSCYSAPDSIDAWRHSRMYDMVLPLIHAYSQSMWMTIGDGKFASDAYSLKQRGADVMATSLTDSTLKQARDKGYIDSFKAINAEAIELSDESYDFIFCKESYHHFSRPAVSIYEMLRVARQAVILIEPQESVQKPLDFLKKLFKKAIRGNESNIFEPCGNFLFRLNIREIEKMLTALNYECLAVKRFNDFYHPRLSLKPYQELSLPTLLFKFGLKLQDALAYLRLLNYGLACVMTFKSLENDALIEDLKQTGFTIIRLPKNPYLNQ